MPKSKNPLSELSKQSPETRLVHGGTVRSQHNETSEAIFLTSGYSYPSSAYAEKLSAGADSVLASLSPEDFAAGMQALRSHAASIDDQAVFEPIDVFIFR